MKYYFTSVFLTILILICAPYAICEGAEVELVQPEVDREASEEAFLRAYDYFLQNRLWNCLDELSISLRENIYFIDAYYMRSLALRRLGRYTDAIDAMSQYLEVRRDDNRAKVILDSMQSEWDLIRGLISPAGDATGIFFESRTINSYLGIQPFEPLALKGMSGIGKITASRETIIVCDTLGDRIWIFDRDGFIPSQSVALNRPIASVIYSPSEALIFQESGGMFRMSLDSWNNPMLMHLGNLEANVSDAEVIDSTVLAVADRSEGVIRFIEMPDVLQNMTWKPEDSGEGKLFEPVAVSSSGSLLAIADRGVGRVFVLDTYTLNTLDSFEVERPRDLAWGEAGELFVLSENGAIYSRYPVGSDSSELKIAAEKMREAWSLSGSGDGVIATSVTGRTWWTGQTKPGRGMAFGSVSMSHPWIETNNGVDFIMIKCAVSSTFQEFVRNREPVTQVVWRGEVRPSRIISIGEGDPKDRGGVVRYYTPGGGVTPNGAPVIPAEAIADVMRDIAELSRGGHDIPGVIVLDSRISGSAGQIELFLAFLLRQGIRFDLLNIDRPAPLSMNRVSKITGGRSYYTRNTEAPQTLRNIEWVLSLPLPPDITTFGYPSDTTLSLYSEIDVIRFTDWMPIWPSLMERNNMN